MSVMIQTYRYALTTTAYPNFCIPKIWNLQPGIKKPVLHPELKHFFILSKCFLYQCILL